MTDRMFESSGVRPASASRKSYTVTCSIVAHVAALLALVVTPLVATEVLPGPGTVVVFSPPPSPPPPAPPVRPEVPGAVGVPPTLDPNVVPRVVPDRVSPEPPAHMFTPLPAIIGGVPAVLSKSEARLSTPPAPPQPAFVRPGGDIREPRKIHDTRPIYPPAAMAARVQGVVTIEATISKDGSVIDASVIESQPLLDQAALDAVRQWRFTPTMLNGVPVEVKITVRVNFALH